jgi:hypothetical protein
MSTKQVCNQTKYEPDKRMKVRIFSLYQTCINYYNIIKDHDYLSTDKVKVSLNTMRSARNEFLVFIRQNNYKCGLNNV